MTTFERAAKLRSLLAAPGILEVPGVFDALTARAAQLNGFEAVFVGGSFTASFTHAIPDIGMVTTTELLAQAARVARAVAVPVIADLDDVGGNPLRVARAMHDAIDAGLAGIQIEDLDPLRGKHLGSRNGGDRLRSVDDAAELIAAAHEATGESGLIIVARTDAVDLTSADDAFERARCFLDAGADIALFARLRPDQVRQAKAIAGGPIAIFALDLTAEERQEHLDAGVDVILHPRAAGMPAFAAAWDALAALRATGTLGAYAGDTHREQYRRAIDADAWNEEAARHGL